MNYYKLSEVELRGIFGPSSSIKDDAAIIVYSGENAGVMGVPKLRLILPFVGVPIDKDGNLVDIRRGFKNAELAKDFYRGFDENTIIIPGMKIAPPEPGISKKSFYVSFEPSKVTHVLIGRRCNQNTSETTRNELHSLAEFNCKGKPKKNEDGTFWDYHILRLSTDYNYVADSNEHLVSDAKFHASTKQVNHRRVLLGKMLNELFGSLDSYTETERTSDNEMTQKTQQLQQENDTASLLASQLAAKDYGSKEVKTWLLKGGLHHCETFVIDEMGRFIDVTSTPRYISKEQIANVEVSSYQLWKNLPEKCIVLRYERNGVSQPAKYAILARPELVTELQIDAINTLEQTLLKETYEIVVKQKLFERFAQRGKESRWAQQLGVV